MFCEEQSSISLIEKIEIYEKQRVNQLEAYDEIAEENMVINLLRKKVDVTYDERQEKGSERERTKKERKKESVLIEKGVWIMNVLKGRVKLDK